MHPHASYRTPCAVLLVLLALAGCDRPGATPAAVSFSGPTMGTQYTVRLSALPGQLAAEQVQAEVDAVLERVNDLMSTYRPDSELSRFNVHEGTDWFDVSPETAEVLAEALRTSEASGGAFDVTVGPLVNLWSFGPGARPNAVPAREEIAEAKERVGYRQIELRENPPAVRKSRPDVYVDLSAIAKGYGVDAVARRLDELGASAYMVEIGGEVRTRGVRPDGGAWRIGIEAPTEGRRGVQKIIELADLSLATSGDYRNYFEENGRRYSHTIDPRTGEPIDHRLVSASVLSETCMRADALATTLMVLGPDEGYNWAVEQDLAVLLIVRAEGGFVERATPAFLRLTENRGRQ